MAVVADVFRSIKKKKKKTRYDILNCNDENSYLLKVICI